MYNIEGHFWYCDTRPKCHSFISVNFIIMETVFSLKEQFFLHYQTIEGDTISILELSGIYFESSVF